MPTFDTREIRAKSILSPCGIPGIDYTINPYTGCSFACSYCYASFMGRFLPGKSIADWGTYVYVKVNAPELLRKEIVKVPQNGRSKEIFISSVTDPYQGLEAKYKLTRQCLEIMADYGFAGSIAVQTKSPLVTRDIDVLKKLKVITVGFTVTSTDNAISRYFEKMAPNVSDRFAAIKKLNEAGISTYAFIGPLLPHFVAATGELESIFRRLVEVGTRDIFVEHLNLSSYIRNRLLIEMKGTDEEIVEKFYNSQSKEYRRQLDKMVGSLVKKYGMNLMLDQTIFHRDFQKSHDNRRLSQLH